MDMSPYRDLFLSEAREHLQAMNSLIESLEENPDTQENINSLFRSAHSMKGMAASMGYDPIAALAHSMESLMTRVREGELSFREGVGPILLEGSDLLAVMLDDVAADRPLVTGIASIKERLDNFTPAARAQPPSDAEPQETTFPQDAEPLKEKSHTVRVKTEILDRLIDTTGELFTCKHRLLDSTQEVTAPRLNETLNDLGRLLRELHQTVMTARLIPFSTVSDRFHRVVRDIARKCGKEISFRVSGGDIELDRRVLEEVTDPLLHILRNAVDHGIEDPHLRTSAGKSPVGKVKMTLTREKDQAVIAVEDDGRGMDPESLVRSAVAKGLITAEKGSRLSPEDALMLTCLPGFSTAAEVTDLSGRGVGMDAVHSAVQSMSGALSIESVMGSGSRIILRLPLSIAIINVLLISAGSLRVALPASAVQRTLEITKEQILVRDHHPYLMLDDAEFPLVNLNRILGLQPAGRSSGFFPVLLMIFNGRPGGVVVDRVIGQREIHVKPPGRPLNSLKALSGAGVLGDGEIVFLLDPSTLL